MKNRMLTATLAGALGIVVSASAAMAAPIISDTIGGTSYAKRYIALEVYNNGVGINADNVPLFVKTNAANTTGAAINIQVTNGKVNEGAGQLFVAARGAEIIQNGGGTCAGIAGLDAATWYLVGESAAQGVVQPVTTQVYDNPTFCLRNFGPTATGSAGNITVPAASTLSTELGTIATDGTANTTVKEAINLSVDPNLNPDCTNKPTVSLAFVTNQETAGPTAVLQIIPQIIGSTNKDALTATLDSDNSFETFVPGSSINPLDATNTEITSGIGSGTVPLPVVTLIDQQTEGINGNPAQAGLFDSFVAPTATTSLSFSLTSTAPQPGVDVSYRGTALTNAGNTWTDTNNVDTLANITNGLQRPLVVANDGTTPMNPTQWTLSSFSLNVNGFQTCVAFTNPVVGSWTGGLEAYIPFVKSAAGYETFIKLANRYTKAAPMFVAALSGANASTSSVVTSTKQLTLPGQFTADLTQIPANGGQVTISGADLVANGVITDADAQSGAAVKILLRVPTQNDFIGAIAGVTTADPYITGIVVSTTPQGQRSIPLDFKIYKNGALVSN